jgi:iron(II)-dependent oxidoreductase
MEPELRGALARTPGREDVVAMLLDARARTLELVAGLTDEQLLGPRLPTVNPLRWEAGHVAWFQERWALRHLWGAPPIREDGDRLYDSAAVAHDTRWDLPLPSMADTLAYAAEVHRLVRERVEAGEPAEPALYFYRLAAFHEDMHGEAFTYTRINLGYPEPAWARTAEVSAAAQEAGPLPGDVEVPGGGFLLGATPDLPFVFDNEKWGHPVTVAPFRIARAPVTNGEFAEFVAAGGYRREDLWTPEGWAWRAAAGADLPHRWERAAGGGFARRWYDRVVRLGEHHPVQQVNAHEAEAYCRWRGRRLPSEAEWELAATGLTDDGRKRPFPWGEEPPAPHLANLDSRARGTVDVAALPAGDSVYGCRQMIGNVWEWTSTRFAPYPGFVLDPYKEYSEPWFRTPHRVLRGGCWATRSRLLRNTWRNFYEPHRRDVFGGLRTCAVP